MEKEFIVNYDMKKKDLKKFTDNQSGYKKIIVIARSLQSIGIVIFIGFVIFAILSFIDTDMLLAGVIAGFGLGFILGSIPFFLGQCIGIKGKIKYGSPYNEMEKESIIISDVGIQFSYCDTENRYANSRDVYQIYSENINDVRYDSEYNIVTIIGVGELIVYDDILIRRINHAKSQRKFYSDSEYSFMLSFDNKDEIVEMLRSKVKR